jgi:hypothetical protein
MARDVSTMFDELKALADKHAELHADRARLQAELERERAELARARRSWWRRLVGRMTAAGAKCAGSRLFPPYDVIRITLRVTPQHTIGLGSG